MDMRDPGWRDALKSVFLCSIHPTADATTRGAVRVRAALRRGRARGSPYRAGGVRRPFLGRSVPSSSPSLGWLRRHPSLSSSERRARSLASRSRSVRSRSSSRRSLTAWLLSLATLRESRGPLGPWARGRALARLPHVLAPPAGSQGSRRPSRLVSGADEELAGQLEDVPFGLVNPGAAHLLVLARSSRMPTSSASASSLSALTHSDSPSRLE